ncbi:hypothetical protein BCR43DRAFT_497479 [Syncephalastrum racemosum]|uniref:Uncharacterized protein n=1 Tax=Syncephalastrum racemosum TaxID=13706 RepID=A0A1X2H2D9_SYNRA|nr:hypothetical protein BCR43DRAFT_497479 [Syncephalastrum racemosum]
MEPTERQTSHDSKEQEPSFRRRRSDATQVVIDTNVKPEEEETGQGQPANEKEKKGPPASWSRRLWNVVKPPPFVQFRKAIKMAIAILLALIMTLDDSCRNAIGAGALLTCVVIVFYFPSRTVGAVAEASLSKHVRRVSHTRACRMLSTVHLVL